MTRRGRMARGVLLRAGAALALALLVAGCGGQSAAAPAETKADRRVWVMSDIHAGAREEGRDGAEWFQLAVDDVRKNVPHVAYALALGDMTLQGSAKGLEAYAAVRDGSKIAPWFELAGNHEAGVQNGEAYRKVVKTPRRYVVLDGNTAWFMVSCESINPATITQETADWLRDGIQRHQGDKNIIVSTHHPVYDTVTGSTTDGRYLAPEARVADLLSQVRVDLWLCGHVHTRPRTPECAATRDRTTFVNVASINHAYATKQANSCILEIVSGSREALVRARDHDHQQYLAGQDVKVTFAYAFRPGTPSEALPDGVPPATKPAITALRIPHSTFRIRTRERA